MHFHRKFTDSESVLDTPTVNYTIVKLTRTGRLELSSIQHIYKGKKCIE